jgi:2-amino-4-hydroxy-6-hydroxymethyldihydropteridine diphosphokinase
MEAVFSLGSNIGDKQEYINQAISSVDKIIGQIIARSSFYVSQPWGYQEQDDFINAAIIIETELSIPQIKESIKAIEESMDRPKVRKKWSSRTLDLDLIFYGMEIYNTQDFQVPHRFMHLRNFVLLPLNEICPEYIHPVFQKSVQTLLKNCPDESMVSKIEA